jgi:hypothetical protein
MWPTNVVLTHYYTLMAAKRRLLWVVCCETADKIRKQISYTYQKICDKFLVSSFLFFLGILNQQAEGIWLRVEVDDISSLKYGNFEISF